MLRTSIHIQFTEQIGDALREAATSESELVDYAFADAQQFLKQIIVTMMDLPSTRESLIRVVKKLNQCLPFLLLNDYRLATVTNSL